MGCLNGRSSSPPPAAPDNSALIDAMTAGTDAAANAASEQTALGREQLQWAKDQWADQKDMTQEIMDVQLPMMRNQAKWALEDRNRWETMVKPMEDQLFAEAKAFDSPGRRAEVSSAAVADVTMAAKGQRENALRQLESYGIDRSQTRSMALDRRSRVAEGAMQAAVSTNAKRYVEDTGRALRGQIVGANRGLPMQAVNTGVSASNIGSQASNVYNQAINTSTNARGVGANYMALGNQSRGQAINGYANVAGVINAGYKNQLAGWDVANDLQQQKTNDGMGTLGTIAGIAASFFADGGEVGNVAEAQGVVSGPGGPKDDTINAQLSDGEYVIPEEVVRYKGTEFFDKLINKSHDGMGIPTEAIQMENGVPVQGAQQ